MTWYCNYLACVAATHRHDGHQMKQTSDSNHSELWRAVRLKV